jgi:hypothetical protein
MAMPVFVLADADVALAEEDVVLADADVALAEAEVELTAEAFLELNTVPWDGLNVICGQRLEGTTAFDWARKAIRGGSSGVT